MTSNHDWLAVAQSDADTLISDGVVSEAEIEQIVDRKVQRRLSTDSRYRYAPDAETQAEREGEIADEAYIETVSYYRNRR